MSRSQKETREKILQTTWRMLESQRGQGVRLEDIAREAEVSRQAIYLHFGSRAELFIATVRYVDEVLRFPERIQQACAAGNGVLGIQEFTALWGSYIPEIYGLAKALLTLRETDEAAAAAWKDRMDALYQGCLVILQQIAADGHLAPEWTAETAADFYYALHSVETWERLTIERGWSQEHYIEQMQRFISRALLVAG